jgi:OmpA-OmpF porin, OOP family
MLHPLPVVECCLKLSLDRANAVMTELVRTHQINGTRLKAFGNGQFVPVASNHTDEGKAMNRRVELAKP